MSVGGSLILKIIEVTKLIELIKAYRLCTKIRENLLSVRFRASHNGYARAREGDLRGRGVVKYAVGIAALLRLREYIEKAIALLAEVVASVVTVKDGVVTATGIGEAMITAHVAGEKYICVIHVTETGETETDTETNGDEK